MGEKCRYAGNPQCFPLLVTPTGSEARWVTTKHNLYQGWPVRPLQAEHVLRAQTARRTTSPADTPSASARASIASRSPGSKRTGRPSAGADPIRGRPGRRRSLLTSRPFSASSAIFSITSSVSSTPLRDFPCERFSGQSSNLHLSPHGATVRTWEQVLQPSTSAITVYVSDADSFRYPLGCSRMFCLCSPSGHLSPPCCVPPSGTSTRGCPSVTARR